MYLAIINKETNLVENIIVPPEGTDAFFLGEGFYGVLTDSGAIGDTYEKDAFVKPVKIKQSESQTE